MTVSSRPGEGTRVIFDAPVRIRSRIGYNTALLFPIVLMFLTKLSGQRERAIVDRAVARIWPGALPPCSTSS